MRLRRWARRAAAVTEAAGGTAGLILTVRLLARTGLRPAVIVLAAVLVILFGGMLLAAGLLWWGKTGGRLTTVLVQVVQLPYVITGPISYGFHAPVALIAGIGNDGWHLTGSWRSGFLLDFDSDPSPWLVAINLVALAVIILTILSREPAPGRRT
ncbi:MAG: hypothetical protein ACHQXA_11215 [Gemmatimonadales bacterium]